MKRIIITLALVALALPVAAQEAPDFSTAEITLGLWQHDTPGSSKFFEYRDIPQGAAAPFFQFQGRSGDFHYNVYGSDVTQKDQQYYGIVEKKSWRFEAEYTGIPHSFGNSGKSPLSPTDATGQTEWRMPDTLQGAIQAEVEGLPARNYDTVLPIVQPTLDAQPANIDLRLQRNRTTLNFALMPEGSNLDVGVTYFHERRTGTRTNNGTAFGFNNVIETPDPIKYITQDIAVNASYNQDWGNVFAGVNFNIFDDKFDTFAWDNPFRVTDSTSGNAYLGPYSTTAGPSNGLSALPPSNKAWNIKAGTNLNFGSSSRLTGDVQIGQWTQNEQQFIGWTTNTAIFLPDGQQAVTAPLPANSLDGKIDVLALNGYFTTKLTDGIRWNARYRLYENDNKTPRIRFEEGYVRFDAVWEEIPRINVPFGFKSNYFDTYVTFDAGRMLGLEVGYKYNKVDREYRETEHTTDNMFRAAADLRFGMGMLRALYEFGDRDFNDYLPVEGEEHSFLEAGQPANQTVLRRYDQSKRDRNRFGAQLQLSPGSGIVTLAASYFYNKDDYDNGPVSCNADYHDGNVGDSADFCSGGTSETLGLEEAKYSTFTIDVDVSPNDRTTLYGFYTREDIMDVQDGRQSGGTLTFDPAQNWISSVDDTVNSIGAGLRFSIVPDEWLLNLFYRYQKVDGNNTFTAGEGRGTPENIADYDDTKLSFFAANLKWNFAEQWAAGIGGFFEQYDIADSQTGNILYYMPGSFFLNPDNGDYDSWTFWLNFTYSVK